MDWWSILEKGPVQRSFKISHNHRPRWFQGSTLFDCFRGEKPGRWCSTSCCEAAEALPDMKDV